MINIDGSMECGCRRECDPYAEMPIMHKVIVRKARKFHRCIECNEMIIPGQQYEFVSALYDGKWFKAKTCLVCVRIRNDYGCSCDYGDLRNTLRELLGIDYVTGELM